MASRRIAASGLDAEIARLVRAGYQLQLQHASSAALVRPKRFSFLAFFLLLLFGFWPVLLYIGWYMAKSDETAYLHFEGGQLVIERGGGPSFLSYVVLGFVMCVVILLMIATLAFWAAIFGAFVTTSGSP